MSSNLHRRAGSIVEVLRHRAHHQGEQRVYTFLRDGEALEEPMTYGQLDLRAQTLAAALNHSAFNVANALGPFLGGIAIAHGYGLASTGLVGSGLALSGLVIWAVALKLDTHK